jgi:hypothetical protein
LQRVLARLLALVALAPLLVIAQPAHAADAPVGPGLGIRLLEAPVNLKNDPRARIYIVDAVHPGARFTRRFEVTNGTDAPLPLQLYAGAAEVTAGSWIVQEGRSRSELTDWITINPPTVVVPPHGRSEAVATFAVPRDASQGERYGVLLAEAPPQKTGTGPAVASRIGIRVYLYVGPGGAPPSDFLVDSMTASRSSAGLPVVSALVHNTGRRALDLRGELILDHGPGGLSAPPFPVSLGTTLGVGDTEPVAIPLSSAITGGPWRARLTLRSGRLERRAEAQLTFPDQPGQVKPPVKAKNLPLAKDRKVLIPVAASLIALLLLVLFVLWLLAKLRNKRQKDDEESVDESLDPVG